MNTQTTQEKQKNYGIKDLINQELKTYLALRIEKRDVNPVKWWAKNKERFPFLYRVAMKYLGCPGTSTACERMFSTTGKIITKQRNRIAPSLVNIQVKLNKNM